MLLCVLVAVPDVVTALAADVVDVAQVVANLAIHASAAAAAAVVGPWAATFAVPISWPFLLSSLLLVLFFLLLVLLFLQLLRLLYLLLLCWSPADRPARSALYSGQQAQVSSLEVWKQDG